MLDQRAAQRDVEHLHAPADREGRRAVADRGTRERDVERVDVLLHAVGVGVCRLPVARRVDVGTADQHEPVEPPDDVVGLVVGDRHLEQCRLLASRALDGVEVAAGADERIGAGALLLVTGDEAGRDGDQRTHRPCLQPFEPSATLPIGDVLVEVHPLLLRRVQQVLVHLLTERRLREG